MIKRYITPEAYAAAGLPTDESRVAEIEQTSEIKVDGVNVVVPAPEDGDAVFEDADGNPKFVRHYTIRKSLLDPSWSLRGYAFEVNARRCKVMDYGENAGLKWLGCWQHSITAISAGTIKFWLHMKGDYAAWIPIEVTLSDSSNGYINATTAAEITAALEAAGNTGNIGYDNHGWWAYLSDDNDEKVTSGGTKIVVQCDFNADYRQYQNSDSSHALVGCTMALSVWGDMPASSAIYRKTGVSTSWSVGNVEKSAAYYATNGKTPTANWDLNTTALVTLDAFNKSAYCADLRAAYGTYKNYIAMNKTWWPHPDYGVLSLIDADEMTHRYGAASFTKKDGVTVEWKFPALHYGLTVGYGTGKFAAGKWHLSDVDEGVEYMDDVVYKKIRDGQTRMNTTLLVNNATRWFARRYDANGAWYFFGTAGYINGNFVFSASRCRAVLLLEF